MDTVVVTGGTGSFGSAFMEHLLECNEYKIRILSRDEHKQETLRQAHPASGSLSYILADIREQERLDIALDGAKYVVHAAALKTVPAGERAVDQFVATNVLGTQNIARAAIANFVHHSLFISSDKAVQATNTYGKTKAIAESIWLQANMQGVSHQCHFAAVRGGNVWGSNGSVLKMWGKQVSQGKPVLVYGPGTTRFHMTMAYWVEFCHRALTSMHGGEIFIPKLRAWRLGDLADAFASTTCGIVPLSLDPREGDKPHESLISPEEISRTVDIGWAYVIEPPPSFYEVCSYVPWEGKRVPASFDYRSCNVELLGTQELGRMV